MRFDSYHPTINFVFFVSAICFTVLFKHPVFILISYITSFVYSIKLNRIKGLVFNAALIPFIAAFAFYYSRFEHFGVTNLGQTSVGNMVTLEALLYGLAIGTIITSVIMWLSCVHAVVTADKVMYIFGRIVPKLSLFISIILRMVPKIKERASKINTAQKAIGRGPRQGNVIHRVRNAVRLLSIVTTWTMENFVESSDSMRSRGYALKGRTAFSIYRFDNRDRSLVIVIFCALTVIFAGFALDQMKILYDPQIIINPVTAFSYVFYAAYAFLCLLPVMLQIVGEFKFKRLKKRLS